MEDHRARNNEKSSTKKVIHDEPQVRNIESDGAGDGAPGQDEPRRSLYTPSMVDELRKKNRLYFMDSISKMRFGEGSPLKLLSLLLKVCLISVQIREFVNQRDTVVEYFKSSKIAFTHLLFYSWDATYDSYETMPYPPAQGPYAFYSFDELCKHMNYAVEQYYQLPEKSLTTVYHITDQKTDEVKPVEMCYKAKSFTEFNNGSYIIERGYVGDCVELTPFGYPGNYTFDITKYIKEHNVSLIFNRTITIELKMELGMFHLNLIERPDGPSCYNVTLTIGYQKRHMSGQILVDLASNPKEVKCEGNLPPHVLMETNEYKNKAIALDVVILYLCIISTSLCLGSLWRSNKLRQTTTHYFWRDKEKRLSITSQMEYINKWDVSMICSDIFTITGTSLKLQVENGIFSFSFDNNINCSICLGLGNILSYACLLRYLTYFNVWKALMLTLKQSFWQNLCFMIYAIGLFSGFTFCGWVAFSPVHVKFRQFSTTVECLFSFLNGDEMFITFSALKTNDDILWYFSRVYLYFFTLIFNYIVLNIFLALVLNSFQGLESYNENGFPETNDTDLQNFINEGREKKNLEAPSCQDCLRRFFLHCFKKRILAFFVVILVAYFSTLAFR